MQNLIGTTLNQYQIQLKIRETGTRILYKAYDTKTFQTVAIDVVKVNVRNPKVLYEFLQAQAKKNSELTHPNIPVAIDSGIYENLIFFVYNFSPLHPLRRLFNKTYTWSELARELAPITKSLAVAHEHNVFHGFLNPASIVITEQMVPVLFDFGFEQIIFGYLISEFPGSWIYTWGYEYCSPEQLKGGMIDCRSDVYAIGMIIYEWLTGEIALREDSAFATLQKRSIPFESSLVLGEGSSQSIQKLINKCIAVDPNERYQTIQEVSVLLSRGALDLAVTEKMVQNPLAATAPSPTRKYWGAILLVVLLAVFGTSLGFSSNLIPVFSGEATQEVSVTKTSTMPEKTKIAPTATPLHQQRATEIVQTPTPVQNPFPMFQGTSLPEGSQILTKEIADEIITVGLWGIGDINRLATSPDGTRIAIGSPIGIFVYDSNNFMLQKHIVTSSWISAIDFSADGSLLAAGDEYGLIRVWDTSSWEEIASLSGHRAGILNITFSGSNSRLASVALDDTLIVWDIALGKEPIHNSVPVAAVTSVAFTSDDQTIITGGNDFKVNLWDASDLHLLKTITLSSKVVDLTILPTSTWLAVGGSDRQISMIDIATEGPIRRLSGLQYPLASVAASPDGKIIAGGDINGGIITWDKNGNMIWKSPSIVNIVAQDNALASPHNLAFSKDGKTLFSGLRNGTLRVFDAINGKEIHQDQSLDVHAQKLAISHNSKYAISQNGNGRIKVWDLYSGQYLYELQGEIMDGSPISPNNLYLAIAPDSSTVKIYELATGKDIYTFNGHQGIKAIRFVDDGKVVAAGQEQQMHAWSMSSGQEIITERTLGGTGCTTIISQKQNALFAVTKFHHIIDLPESQALCGFQIPDWMKTFYIDDATGRVAYGGSSKLAVSGFSSSAGESIEMDGVNHQNIVSVAIDPQGGLLAAAFDDNTIHLWDITSHKELIRLYGHTNLITDLQFTPNGKLLLSTSLDGTIRLWGIP